MLSKINTKKLIGAIICFVLAGLIMFGKSGITFSDVLNELAVFAGFVWFGIMLLFGSY